MDGIPPAGVTGALASHQVQQQQAAERARARRALERRGSAEDSEAPDAPVERTEASSEVGARLPDADRQGTKGPPTARERPETDPQTGGLDVLA